MNRYLLLFLFIFLSASVFADSNILKVKETVDQLNSDLISAKLAPANLSKKEILGMIKETEELNCYLYQTFLEVDYDNSKLEEFYFSNESNYPLFCNDLTDEKNLSRCFNILSHITSSLGKKFGFLYVSGDVDSSDFKTMTLVYDTKEESKKLIIALKLQQTKN